MRFCAIRFARCSKRGAVEPFEDTTDSNASWTVRGLGFGHRYGFRIRGVNAVGVGAATQILYGTPTVHPVITIPSGQPLPLLDADRQSLIVRLADKDCRVSVWWHPEELSWYGSLEIPTNTIVVRSQRLGLNIGLLDRIMDALPGNLVLRETGAEGFEPARDSIGGGLLTRYAGRRGRRVSLNQ